MLSELVIVRDFIALPLAELTQYRLPVHPAGAEQAQRFDEVLQDLRAFALVVLVLKYKQPQRPMDQSNVRTEQSTIFQAITKFELLAEEELMERFDNDVVANIDPAIKAWHSIKWSR